MAKTRLIECIFCGDSQVPQAKEDVLPLWLARKLAYQAGQFHPGTEATYVNYSYASFADLQNDDITGSGATARQTTGAIPAAYKTPEVCTECNNGWMSRLETAAKLIIPGLLIGTPKRLTPYDQLVLATWATKTSLTYDVAREPQHVPSQAGTRRLFALGYPLPGTHVIIGHDPTIEPMGEVVHARQPFSAPGQSDPIAVIVRFQFDRLILHTNINLSDDGTEIHPPTGSPRFKQIWPPGEAFRWPSVDALDYTSPKASPSE